MSHRIASVLTLAAALLALIPAAPARSGSDGAQGRRPYRLPPNLLEYLGNKYAIVEESLVSTIQETPDGPLGSFGFRAHIAPKGPISGATAEDRARAVARAFINDESALLGIMDPAELKEFASRVDEDGVATVHYVRTIGDLELVGTGIRVDVGPDNAITRFYATLSPSPAALYEAATKPTLTEKEIARIVEQDLTHGKKIPAQVSILGKSATWRPPYVSWGATGSIGGKPAWGYSLDAFTGKILTKGCTAISIQAWTDGNSPCD